MYPVSGAVRRCLLVGALGRVEAPQAARDASTALGGPGALGLVVLEDNGKVDFADDGKWGIGHVLACVEPIGCHHLDKIAVPR